jgi:hypothetical protein
MAFYSCEDRVAAARASSKKWRDANLEHTQTYMRGHHRFKKYGITPVEWDVLFASQGYRCAVCGTDKPGSKMGWHTDHGGPLPCTKDNIRGILCLHCNHSAKKGTRQDIQNLRRLAEYLEAHSG